MLEKSEAAALEMAMAWFESVKIKFDGHGDLYVLTLHNPQAKVSETSENSQTDENADGDASMEDGDGGQNGGGSEDVDGDGGNPIVNLFFRR